MSDLSEVDACTTDDIEVAICIKHKCMEEVIGHPHIVPDLYDLLFSLKHKERLFKKCLDVSGVFCPTMEVNCDQNCLVTNTL